MESEDWMGLSTSMLLDPDTYLFHEIGNIEDFLEPHWELPFNPDENDDESEGREWEIATGENPNGDAFIKTLLNHEVMIVGSSELCTSTR